jgi:hypothetical protein
MPISQHYFIYYIYEWSKVLNLPSFTQLQMGMKGQERLKVSKHLIAFVS